MRKSRGTEKRAWIAAVRAVLLGAIGGTLAAFLLLAACAYAFVSMKSIPQNAVPVIILTLSALTSFASGFLTARISGQRGLPLGACAALLLFALFSAAGLSAGAISSWAGLITRMAVMLLAGALGGYCGVRRK